MGENASGILWFNATDKAGISNNQASIELVNEAAPFFVLSKDQTVATLTGLVYVIDREWRGIC